MHNCNIGLSKESFINLSPVRKMAWLTAIMRKPYPTMVPGEIYVSAQLVKDRVLTNNECYTIGQINMLKDVSPELYEYLNFKEYK